MPVTELTELPRIPPPDPYGGEEEVPWCFSCLVGRCPHGKSRGHEITATTQLNGTTLCTDCAVQWNRGLPA